MIKSWGIGGDLLGHILRNWSNVCWPRFIHFNNAPRTIAVLWFFGRLRASLMLAHMPKIVLPTTTIWIIAREFCGWVFVTAWVVKKLFQNTHAERWIYMYFIYINRGMCLKKESDFERWNNKDIEKGLILKWWPWPNSSLYTQYLIFWNQSLHRT